MISVEGCSGLKHQEIVKASNWYYNKHLSDLDLKIKIRIKNMNPNDYGECNQLSISEYSINIRRGCNLYDSVSSTFHELVHVKQYARKELEYLYNHGSVRWKSRNYRFCHYDDQPWEKEAYRMEQKLMKIYTKNFQSSVDTGKTLRYTETVPTNEMTSWSFRDG